MPPYINNIYLIRTKKCIRTQIRNNKTDIHLEIANWLTPFYGLAPVTAKGAIFIYHSFHHNSCIWNSNMQPTMESHTLDVY